MNEKEEEKQKEKDERPHRPGDARNTSHLVDETNLQLYIIVFFPETVQDTLLCCWCVSGLVNRYYTAMLTFKTVPISSWFLEKMGRGNLK